MWYSQNPSPNLLKMTFIKLQASQYNIEVRLFIVEGGKTSWNPLEPHPQASLS
jgi:hypothetical protein